MTNTVLFKVLYSETNNALSFGFAFFNILFVRRIINLFIAMYDVAECISWYLTLLNLRTNWTANALWNRTR